MPSFKLDGEDIPFEPGETIMNAAWKRGVEIPHYCWHPGLSIAANCRMCLVEIKSDRPVNMPVLVWDEKKQKYVQGSKPKLTPACQAPAVEGQEVFAKSAEALTAQSSVQEFLLLNHPVDCPICDQAGECKLQDYWLTSQGKLKRKLSEPVHKPKGVRFGPTIVYDGERCIMCTRCIRFCDEVAKDHVLDMRERGNKNEIVVSPGRELDNRYTFMTEHVCPVGALTTEDFRFKARVWFLRAQESICPGCATGCNSFMDYDPRNNRVYRLRPRDNPEVNQFWMCDDGMMSYHAIHEGRVMSGVIRNGQSQATMVSEALSMAADRLKEISPDKVAFVLSALHSTEDNFAAAELARVLGSERLYLAARGGWEGDDILRDSDNNPNRRGATLVASGSLKPLDALVEDVRSGSVSAVVALGGECAQSTEELSSLKEVPLVALAANEGPLTEIASVVIPVAHQAETDGTFVNAKGMEQRFRAAIPPPPGVRAGWKTVNSLGEALGKPFELSQLSDVRRGIESVRPPAPEATV